MNNSVQHSFWDALKAEKPLQIIGTINAYVAIMAKTIGYEAIYLSGAGVANSSYGLPDLGITTLDNVLEDVRRIKSAVDLPLLVDIDTGFGSAFNIARTIKEMIKAGASAVHIEDQVSEKRCGHRPGKEIVQLSEMVDRIKSAVDARTNDKFVIMARTDSLANEGMDKAIERIIAYKNAGADMIFPEALTELPQYKKIKDAVNIPILANITEFGKTPLFTLEELNSACVDMVLYPLSVNRIINKSAELALKTIRKDKTQKNIIDRMQTRDELYEYLGYLEYENKLDKLFKSRS